MADYLPSKYTIPPIKTGDTWDGLAIKSVKVNNANPANTLSSVAMQFRTLPGATSPSLDLNSTAGGTTINDNATWNCTVNSITVSMTPGTYYYDVQFTDSAGKIKTYLEGTWEIDRDVTR